MDNSDGFQVPAIALPIEDLHRQHRARIDRVIESAERCRCEMLCNDIFDRIFVAKVTERESWSGQILARVRRSLHPFDDDRLIMPVSYFQPWSFRQAAPLLFDGLLPWLKNETEAAIRSARKIGPSCDEHCSGALNICDCALTPSCHTR